MEEKIHGFLPATAQKPSDRQRLFVRYLTGMLIDLVVLNLFAEYWRNVHVESFTISLLAAILLQALIKLTIAFEHRVAVYFGSRPGSIMRFMRFFGAWFVLFLSKFLILESLAFVFGDAVRFEGALHGLLTLIAVVFAMIIAEELFVRLFRRLA